MYVVAILFANYLIKHEVRRRAIEMTSEEVTNFVIWVMVGGVVGARLYYVIFNPGYYMLYPAEIPAVWHGGLAIHGGLIGGFITAWIYLKRHKLRFWEMADAVAPVLILGQAFGRFGNFMNGDAHGRPTSMSWGIVFPPESIAGTEFPGIPLHPAMLYELIINLAVFFFLWFVVRKRDYKFGFLMASYIMLYSVGRLFVEHFRADSLMLGPLKAAQTVSIIIILVVGAIVIKGRMWGKEESTD